MKDWSNIQTSLQDPEIIRINHLENKLGAISHEIRTIRALITRFEVCHFKYRQHIQNIKDSISALSPVVNPHTIGINHIRHGEGVVLRDTTGRSLTGQQYIWALGQWLKNTEQYQDSAHHDTVLEHQIDEWLGERDSEKKQLVRLLLARLTYNWQVYEKLQQTGKYQDLQLQADRMDICHYAFPKNLNLLIKAIGEMKAVEEAAFEGCGSYNPEIKTCLEKEFSALNQTLASLKGKDKLTGDDLTRFWLIACLAKTIKENLPIDISIHLID